MEVPALKNWSVKMVINSKSAIAMKEGARSFEEKAIMITRGRNKIAVLK